MAKLIALTGPQQVGKTSAANSLVRDHKFTRVAFADPMYRMLAALLESSFEAVRQLPKNEPMEALEGKTLREALQTLGTEWGRSLIGDGIWRSAAKHRIEVLQKADVDVVVDDCRFLNECDMLKGLGASIVRLQRADMPEQINTTHGSEVEWPKFQVHATVTNYCDGPKSWDASGGSAILAALRQSSLTLA